VEKKILMQYRPAYLKKTRAEGLYGVKRVFGETFLVQISSLEYLYWPKTANRDLGR